MTTTRIWELALGGLLTLLPGVLTRALARQGWLAWVGLGMIVLSAFVFDGASEFPGTVALLPVGGSALLIACGSAAARHGPAPITSLRPMVFLGDISYSLYLWHWPIIVLWKAKSGDGIGYLDGPVIAAASVVLGVDHEGPRRGPRPTGALHHPQPGPIARHGGDSSDPGGHWSPSTHRPRRSPAPSTPGTRARRCSPVTPPPPPGVAPIPTPAQAPLDYDPFSACETPIPSVAPRPCTYGRSVGAKLRVALVGDSVANQYRAILSKAATQRNWFVVSDLHGQCPWTATTMARFGTSRPYTACHDWGRIVLSDLLTKYKPDVVVTSERPVLGTPDHPTPDKTSFGEIATGMVQYWKQLEAHGIRVVAVNESPEPGRNIPDCLSRPGNDAAACTSPTSLAIKKDTALQQAVRMMNGRADLMDLNSLICEPTSCPPIIGNVVVYRDTHHLTQTYITSLAPYFMRKLLATKAVRAALS